MPSYKIEFHRVWVKTVEAKSRQQARQVAEDQMAEDPDAEDYNYSVVKRPTTDRDSDATGHNGVWGT